MLSAAPGPALWWPDQKFNECSKSQAAGYAETGSAASEATGSGFGLSDTWKHLAGKQTVCCRACHSRQCPVACGVPRSPLYSKPVDSGVCRAQSSAVHLCMPEIFNLVYESAAGKDVVTVMAILVRNSIIWEVWWHGL